jgi:hypothetical protein
MLIHSISTIEIRKKVFTFDRLEQYFKEGDKERFALENFIYESIFFIKSISKHLPEAVNHTFESFDKIYLNHKFY